MKLIEPAQLVLPRVYFTEFDRITCSQVAWSAEDVEGLKLNLERKVKLLALIKGHVIIATSHLFESELAQEFIMEYPLVLEKGIIIPALISKHTTFSEFLSDKRTVSKEREKYASRVSDEINSLLSNTADSVVSWDLHLTSNWFKERLLRDLSAEKSVLRSNLPDVPSNVIADVIARIQELGSPSRGEIYKIANDSGNKILSARLSDYTDFIYYLSGARAVNSESVLPQENLIDFNIADFEAKKTLLSDYEIFYRIFISIIKERTQKIFPLEILDILDFEDIVELRENLLHSGFVEKYNALLERTKERVEIRDTERLVLNMDELAQFEEELFVIFTDAVIKEIYQMKKIKFSEKGAKVLTSTASLLTFYGAIESIIQLTVNVLSFFGFESRIRATEKNIQRNLQKLEKLIDTGTFDQKPLLIKFLQEITQKYSSKLIA